MFLHAYKGYERYVVQLDDPYPVRCGGKSYKMPKAYRGIVIHEGEVLCVTVCNTVHGLLEGMSGVINQHIEKKESDKRAGMSQPVQMELFR